MVNAKINGVNIEVEKGTSILDAAKKLNIKTLLFEAPEKLRKDLKQLNINI